VKNNRDTNEKRIIFALLKFNIINMIHTVYIDDEDIDGRKLLTQIRRNNRGVRLTPPKADYTPPDGYMTVEDFRIETKKSLTKMLNEHGIC